MVTSGYFHVTNLLANFPRLPFSLTADQMNEAAMMAGDNLVDFVETLTAHLKDSGVVTMKDMTPQQQFQTFVQMTDPRDFQFLMDPDYWDKMKAGLAPVLVSPRWATMLSWDDLFRDVQSDFRRIMRARIPEVAIQ